MFRKIVSDCQVKSGYLCQLVRVLDKIEPVGKVEEKKSLPKEKKTRQIAACERQRIARKLCNSVSI